MKTESDERKDCQFDYIKMFNFRVGETKIKMKGKIVKYLQPMKCIEGLIYKCVYKSKRKGINRRKKK